ALRADPLEHPCGDLLILLERLRGPPAQDPAEPGELAHRHEREPLVVRLEDLLPRPKLVAPGRVVVRDPRVHDEVVVATGNRNRVELDGAQPAKDLEHRGQATSDRASGREELARDEEAPRGLSADVDGQDATDPA